MLKKNSHNKIILFYLINIFAAALNMMFDISEQGINDEIMS